MTRSCSAAVREGDTAFTIGNPLGLERSTAQGMVSKVNRNFSGRLYIQTTAPISPGNSGGPLFNDRGEIVGVINMGYMYRDGLNFAIPSTYVKEFLDNVDAFAFDAVMLLVVEGSRVVLEMLDERAGLGPLIEDLSLAFVDLAAAVHI